MGDRREGLHLLPQAPNALLIMPLRLKRLGAAARGSKSGSYDPEELLDVSKPSEGFVGGQGASMGVEVMSTNIFKDYQLYTKYFKSSYSQYRYMILPKCIRNSSLHISFQNYKKWSQKGRQ
jgi:hypothetical protein